MNTYQAQAHKSYTPAEVAKYLGMKTSSIYALISRGYLQANKIGSRRAITPYQLDHYILNRGNNDLVIDLTKRSTLLSGNTTLQGAENQVLETEHGTEVQQWP
jgi:excisionase family DNA binding protein